MANNAYIVPKQPGFFPVPDFIDWELRQVIRAHFPVFSSDFDASNSHWTVRYRDDPYLKLTLWVGEMDDAPCLVFRHGHHYDFMWWLEAEIRIRLARKMTGVMTDDAHLSDREDPDISDLFPTYMDWKRSTVENHPMRDFLLQLWWTEANTLPEELHYLIDAL